MESMGHAVAALIYGVPVLAGLTLVVSAIAIPRWRRSAIAAVERDEAVR
ncbi:hypothetical protein ABZ479_04470 [Streptomyces sp. NPDC005722]